MKSKTNRKQINFESTSVFERNLEALKSDKRFVINEGGSRSSKTVSICQILIMYAITNPGKNLSIVRKSFPSLRKTAMKDFFDELKKIGLYNKAQHNKTENIFTFDNGSIVSFFSADDEQKLRGIKHSIVWLNESNEVDSDKFVQLNLRTEEKIIFDYNPSESDSWLYSLPEEDSILIRSTYKDNPFLNKNIIKQIESYKETDPELYEVFALGNRIQSRQSIYANWEFVPSKPQKFTNFIYGIDYGFNHPSALIKIWYYESELYIEEGFYERHLTSDDILKKVNSIVLEKSTAIIAETARPEINESLQREGFYLINADKAVKEGINAVKSFKIYVQSSSKNIKKEYENYKWKKKGDQILDEPIKLYNDAMDAIRYGVLYIKNNLSYNAEGPEFFSLEY